jgi:hypothetical protein
VFRIHYSLDESEMTIWPYEKKFAFTILDDTDCSTLENTPQVYQFLSKSGFRTTKSVWVLDGKVTSGNQGIVGTTCEDGNYLSWVKNLQDEGYEIASHSTTYSSSKRSQVIHGLECFKKHFGAYPTVLAQHDELEDNESIYWGSKRVSGIARWIYNFLHILRGYQRNIYFGEIEKSEYFWGDICKERIKYVRNFVFPQINTLKASPYMPYHDSRRPYVNYWFASTEAPDLSSFLKVMSERNQNRLLNEGGACIIYTHFGKNFVRDGKLDPEFIKVMESLAAKEGWFVPVGEMLDYLLQNNPFCEIRNMQRSLLEWKWMLHKFTKGSS